MASGADMSHRWTRAPKRKRPASSSARRHDLFPATGVRLGYHECDLYNRNGGAPRGQHRKSGSHEHGVGLLSSQALLDRLLILADFRDRLGAVDVQIPSRW